MSKAERIFLADITKGHQVRNALDIGKQLVLALCLEIFLELESHVEVVLDGALAPARNQHDIFDARGNGLLHDILDKRLINKRQHFLGRCLGRRQKTGAKSGSRKNRFHNPGGHFSQLPGTMK